MKARANICLKKGEDRRLRAGHPWIFSNEINTSLTPLKSFAPGEEVGVMTHQGNLLGVAYVNPHSLIAARLFSRDPEAHLNVEFFITHLKAALELRERLFAAPYYRLLFSEGDGVPGLIIDRFGHDLVIQVNTAGMENKKTEIIEAVLSLLPETTSILWRNDSPIREQEKLNSYIEPAFGTPPDTIHLQENEVAFSAPLWKGQKTGWFYDHRLTRARLKQYVAGRTVLDVFSYLGGFGIQAAVFGAKQVDCVEVSAPAGRFIQQNATLNHAADKVNLIHQDAFETLKQLVHNRKKYDVIVLDPPAFVKKAKDRKEGLLAYQRINEFALRLLSPYGILFSCTCSMQVSMEDLVHLLQRAAYRAECKIQILERGHQGPDHPVHIAVPETDYLKTIIVRKIL